MRLIACLLVSAGFAAAAHAQPQGQSQPAQWGDSPLKGAVTQNYDGQAYQAIEFEKLEQHLSKLCNYNPKDEIIGQPIATIVGYRQNMGWPTLVDGRQIDLVKTPDERGKTDLVLPGMVVDVTPFLSVVREDPYFKGCSGFNLKVCNIAIYGRISYRPNKTIPDWPNSLYISDKHCTFELEHYRPIGMVDYGGDVADMTWKSFFKPH